MLEHLLFNVSVHTCALAEKKSETGLGPLRTQLSENFILKIGNTEIS